ncbi:hypothetical protein [Mycobacterium sp. IS-3022]|uniref:hypothetical protein n=1 Tax=Mycobacterium sp. IS-3022 TaxID=1772277 RepID=UPI0007417792|nr:hypothetical protein [Mycobacterium sp. IS-3022]KUI02623.1 hypothetical protein AU188_14530 [Mycobacterium sp. IS-3022]
MPNYDYDGAEGASQPWHNRTPLVVGASAVALAVVAVLILAITYLSRHFSEPEEAPLNFVEPTFSATPPPVDTPTTTQTITSTSPPQTTEIGGPLDPSTSPLPTSTSESSPQTTSASPTLEEDESEESTERTTRRRPRTNVTRTFDPYP